MSLFTWVSGGLGFFVLLVVLFIWLIFARDREKEDSTWPTLKELKKIRGW